jgi:peroxiredoxin
MRLEVGQQAPLFDVIDLDGRRLRLADYRGTRVLLSFYRTAVCPLCDLRLGHLIDRAVSYRRQGLALLGFFESSPELTREYVGRMRAPFPVVPDRERKVYDLYGLESSLLGVVRARLIRGAEYREAAAHEFGAWRVRNLARIGGRFGRMPAEFLLGPDLRIRRAYYGHDSGDFMLFTEIDALLAA